MAIPLINIADEISDRMGWCGLDLSGTGKGPVEDSCEHSNEPSVSKQFWEILE
jgi:hypothetical protein